MAAASLLRPTLTLLTGGALAQALPLLLGPWLTRLYTPAEFGQYHLFAAVAANLAVVACGRYEFALPIAADPREATLLRALCLRLLGVAVVASAVGGLAWSLVAGPTWPLWLPVAVGVLGAVSLSTLLATRAQRFKALAAARVVQHGGGALAQVLAGLAQSGVQGLIAAPLAAAAASLALLRLRMPGGPACDASDASDASDTRTSPSNSTADLLAVARQHRQFPLLNTPHAFLGALQDTLSLALIAASLGASAAGAWGLAMRYLKAPATLVGGALSQALYPRLAAAGPGVTAESRALVRQAMLTLGAIALPLVGLLLWLAPDAFAWAFGPPWREAGELARALALYVGVHFVASPLAVVTMAWQAQAWALRLALVGQVSFVAALALGLAFGHLAAAGWAVSAVTTLYFGVYFWKLAHWPLSSTPAPATPVPT